MCDIENERVCVCECVCVFFLITPKIRKQQIGVYLNIFSPTHSHIKKKTQKVGERECVCVCVRVCERESYFPAILNCMKTKINWIARKLQKSNSNMGKLVNNLPRYPDKTNVAVSSPYM